MTEKILLFTDKQRISELQRDIEDAKERSNQLIRTFEKFQPWKKITAFDTWLDLVSDPVATFDTAILNNVSLATTGGLTPNPAVLAQVFNIDREGFIASVKKLISLQEFKQFSKYLIFQNRGFAVAQKSVEKEMERYNYFIENDRQRAVYDHWQGLCDILNDHCKRGYIGSATLSQAGQLVGLRFVPDMIKLFVDERAILSEILKLQ